MISVVMFCKNNQVYIHKTLEALKNFDEVILIDTGSKDQTIQIAQTFSNVRVFKEELKGFGELRNKGAKLAKNNWILALDTDEVIQEELSKEINSLKLLDDTVYEIPFKNFYNNKWIKGCGWYPESHVRLYNKTKTSFSQSLVHEKVININHKVVKLKHFIYHTSYHKVYDFIEKMQKYSDLFAIQNVGKKKSSFSIALMHSITAFFKSYFFKRGFLVGKEGFIISFYNASTALFKYLKLAELNKQKNASNTLVSSPRKW